MKILLQGYLNDHPSIGYSKLLQALELNMNVTSSTRAMRTWLSHHDPIIADPVIADYEEFLAQEVTANPSIGYKALMNKVKKAKGVSFREAPIRAWLAAHKGAPAIATPAQVATSSSNGPMAVLDLGGLEPYADWLRQQL